MREHRIEKLLEMIAANQEDIFALYAMGMECFGLNRFEDAEKYFLKVLAFEPQKVTVYYQLARLEQIKGEEEAALKYLKKGLDLLSESVDIKTKNEFQCLINEIEC